MAETMRLGELKEMLRELASCDIGDLFPDGFDNLEKLLDDLIVHIIPPQTEQPESEVANG